MPTFVRKALNDRGLWQVYKERPPYQQNDYVGWIARAKLAATKIERLNQMLDELEGGKLYMNMAWQPRAERGLSFIAATALTATARLKRQTTKETMMNRKADPLRTIIRGKGWKKTTTMATDKYRMVSRAIMASLTKTPMAFSHLVTHVEARLKFFDGSIPWYTITCLRELEMRGKVIKHQKPVRYSKP